MRKIIIAMFIVAGCSVNHEPRQGSSGLKPNESNVATEDRLIGGWAPVFFTSLDTLQLDDLANGIISGRIKRLVISYPTRMEELAQQIHDYLQQKAQVNILLQSLELKDTQKVKYNLTQVIVTVYFN